MREEFTDRSRKVMALANQEAHRFNHEYIGTEHILLGLVKEGSGVAANVLRNLNVDLRKVRLEVEKIVKNGPETVTLGRLPQTPRTKKVIRCAIEEARNLNHNYVGTEHLLLGLLREQDGVAVQVITCLGVETEEVREAVLHVIQSQPLGYNETREENRALILERDADRKLTFVEIAKANDSSLVVNVAVVCNITNLVLCIVQAESDTEPRIVLNRRIWNRDDLQIDQICEKVKSLCEHCWS